MRRTLPSLSTRAEEADRRELQKEPRDQDPRPGLRGAAHPAGRLRDALLRWLEEEL